MHLSRQGPVLGVDPACSRQVRLRRNKEAVSDRNILTAIKIYIEDDAIKTDFCNLAFLCQPAIR